MTKPRTLINCIMDGGIANRYFLNVYRTPPEDKPLFYTIQGLPRVIGRVRMEVRDARDQTVESESFMLSHHLNDLEIPAEYHEKLEE